MLHVCDGDGMTATTFRTILVVDDDDLSLSIISRMLLYGGFKVLSAASGAAAIEIVQAQGATLDLVVLDMTMPVMDGTQTFAALHQLQPTLPFLIYTGGCVNEALHRLLATGLCTHLIKPCPMGMLIEKAQQMIAAHPRQPTT